MSQTIDNYEEPQKFSEKLDSLKQQLPSILDDYEKYYVLYHKNPDYNEYQQSFQGIKANLNNVNSQLFILSNDVEKNTNKLNRYLVKLNKQIDIQKTKNTKLKKSFGNVEGENAATTEMINNYKEMYNNVYLRNWGLLLSIVIAGFAISKVYANKVVNTVPLNKF